MSEYKTPGVYIKEKNAFGNSVVEAETAIPAFIGYTEKARNGNNDLKNVPWKISSMTEFIQYFGGAPTLNFTVDIETYNVAEETENQDGTTPSITDNAKAELKSGIFEYTVELKEKDDKIKGYTFCIKGKNKYTLYYNMLLFFANGGGICYIISVGNYKENSEIVKKDFDGVFNKLKLIQEITMIVIPEAVNLSAENDFKDVQQQMLSHCGYDMKNRFALLDIYPKADENTGINSQVEVFWNNIGSNFLSYGAAYFPWLNTSVLGDRDLDGSMFTWTKTAYDNLGKFAQVDDKLQRIAESFMHTTLVVEEEKTITIGGIEYKYADIRTDVPVTVEKSNPNKKTITFSPPYVVDKTGFHLALNNASYLYQQAMKAVKKSLNLLPPSAAMAGIYTMVDRSRGVWKAPANVTLSYVDSVAEDIDDEQQAGLNAPMNGKAINVIRPFRGEGIKVWGARTLDGNSLDWRYINVRRTLLFLEESVKNAARAYVFEPNDAGTWINMKCMIESFLRSVWKRGGLAGATPEDAYEVHIGLGDTMTAEDILEGIMRVTVLVAVTHPAEFIEITFQQQMQKS